MLSLIFYRFRSVALVLGAVVFTSFSNTGKKRYTNSAFYGLCSATVVLGNNDTFFYERGCEHHSDFCAGTWYEKQDTVFFLPFDPRSFPVLQSISASHDKSDTVSVLVLDKNGNRLDSDVYLYMDVHSQQNNWTELYMGQRVRRQPGDTLVLSTLENMFEQKLRIPLDTGNAFVIRINFPGEWIRGTEISWSEHRAFHMCRYKNELLHELPAGDCEILEEEK